MMPGDMLVWVSVVRGRHGNPGANLKGSVC